MKTHPLNSIAIICALSVLSLVSARGEDNTTNIISATVLANGGATYTVGSTGTNNYLRIDSGGRLTNILDAVIGNAATANDNSVLVTGSGSFLSGPSNGKLFVGNSGSRNSLTISNGAVVTEGNRIFLGGAVGSGYNSALITGTNSVLQTDSTASQNFFVGRLGVGNNTMTISNGGAAFANPASGFLGELLIGGDTGGNNLVTVTGPGSIWKGNHTLQIAPGTGTNNRLVITNGGQVVFGDNGLIGFDGTGVGKSNSVVVTGPGSLLQGPLDPDINFALGIGYTTIGNTLTISNGGTVSDTLGFIGQFAAANSALVTGAGSSWQNLRNFAVGYSSTATGGRNSLMISNGGAVTNGVDAYIGMSVGTNVAVVTGTGSVWQSYGNLWLGNDPGMGNNSLTISNGGAVYGSRVLIGGLGGNNTVVVSGAGSVLSASDQVDVGQYSAGNTLTIANGGLVDAGFIAMNYNAALLNIGDGTAQATARALNVLLTFTDDRLNFNTGTLSATADAAGFILGDGTAYVQSGGAVIDSQTFSVAIPVALLADGSSPGGGLTKIGSGVLTLGGANTYTGLTTVSNGTLNVTGSLASGVDVKGDAALTGNGIISGPVTIEADATLQPGLGGLDTSTLVINNTLNLGGITVMVLNRTNAQNSTRISGITTLTPGGALTVVNVGDALQAGDAFTLYNAASVASGTLTATNLPSLGSGLSWTFNPASGVLAVASSVDPTPTNIVYSVSGNTLTLTWPGSHLGWYAQSNSVNVAVPGDWFDIAGSQATTNLSITIDPALPQVYYRLRLP